MDNIQVETAQYELLESYRMHISPFSEPVLPRPIGGATPLCVRLTYKLHQNIVQTPPTTYPKLARIGPVAEKLSGISAERFLLVLTVEI